LIPAAQGVLGSNRLKLNVYPFSYKAINGHPLTHHQPLSSSPIELKNQNELLDELLVQTKNVAISRQSTLWSPLDLPKILAPILLKKNPQSRTLYWKLVMSVCSTVRDNPIVTLLTSKLSQPGRTAEGQHRKMLSFYSSSVDNRAEMKISVLEVVHRKDQMKVN
jgi:hypothetical protein